MTLNPAEYVIYIFGGVRKTARICGRHYSSVSKWQNYVDSEGQVGNIPTPVKPILLKEAKKLGLDLTAEDLIYGRRIRRAR